MSQESKAGHLPQLSKIRLLLPYLTINRPGFSKPSKARGQIPKEKYLKIFLKMSHHNQGRRSRSDHSDLGRTKNLFIYGQSLVFSEFWSDQ